MLTLTILQDQALEKLNTTRSSERRYARFAGTVFRWYVSQCATLGYSAVQARVSWKDVRDMLELHQATDNAN